MHRESSCTVRSESGWWRLQESSQARTEGAVRPWVSLVQGRSVVLRWLQAQVEAQARINRFQLLR